MAVGRSSSMFRPTASWENLRLRARLLGRVREYFGRQGFLEVETPILSADTVIDRHLDPMVVDAELGPGVPCRLWLQTSPEFGMKRLLAAGAPSIYQISRVFRRGELGPLHNPEFTMVEWYGVGDDYHDGMRRLGEIGEVLLERGVAERMSYRAAFERYAGFDPQTIATAELVSAAVSAGVIAPDSMRPDDRDGWLDLVLVERVQQKLGFDRPVILYDFPASQAALARVRAEEPPVAERFELYVNGIELANGYHELLDAEVLRRRNAEANSQRVADGKEPLPEESRLLAAMDAGLPPSTGVALGLDRVVMLAAGASRLDEVMAFAIDRA